MALAFAALLVPACGGGGGGPITITPPPVSNQPPGVTLISPTAGSTFITGSSIPIEANVTDVDGFVTGVDFFDGATLIGTAPQIPFRLTWTASGPGTASLTADRDRQRWQLRHIKPGPDHDRSGRRWPASDQPATIGFDCKPRGRLKLRCGDIDTWTPLGSSTCTSSMGRPAGRSENTARF